VCNVRFKEQADELIMQASSDNVFSQSRLHYFWERSWFTVALMASYIGIFNIWLLQKGSVAGTGGVYVVALSLLALFAWKRGYFVGAYDLLFHLTVILDVYLESTYIAAHDHVGFYLCALGFAVVIGGYRYWALSKKRKNT
jgi:hypothetical protein